MALSSFLPVTNLTHLTQEQNPAVKLVLSELEVSGFFSLLVCGRIFLLASYPLCRLSQLSTLRIQRQHQQVEQQSQGIAWVHSVVSSLMCVRMCVLLNECATACLCLCLRVSVCVSK